MVMKTLNDKQLAKLFVSSEWFDIEIGMYEGEDKSLLKQEEVMDNYIAWLNQPADKKMFEGIINEDMKGQIWH